MAHGKISRILVPLDGSENSVRALDTAISIASGCGSTLVGFYCIHEQHRSEFGGSRGDDAPDPEAKKFIKAAADTASGAGVKFEEKTASGEVGYNIVEAAREEPRCDMIVMGSKGRSATKQMFFGSASNYVVHTAKMPVVIVK